MSIAKLFFKLLKIGKKNALLVEKIALEMQILLYSFSAVTYWTKYNGIYTTYATVFCLVFFKSEMFS